MQNVTRLADQYFDTRRPDALDRHEGLLACVALVTVFHLIASIAFAKLQEIEKRHHLFHPAPSITYDLMIAPPAVHKTRLVTPKVPPPIALEQGKAEVGGKSSAPKHSEQIEIPVPTKKVVINDEERILPKAQPLPQLVAAMPPGEEHGAPTADWSGGSGDQHGDSGIGSGAGGTIGGATQIANAGGETLPTADQPLTKNKRDIAPYRTGLLLRLAQVWRPKKDDGVVLLIRIASDGSLVEAKAETATDERAAERVMKAVEQVQFEPLPDWYHGADMRFRLHMGAPVD